MVPVGLGVARQDEVASVGGRHMNIDHLYGRECVEDCAGCQPRGVGADEGFQGDLQAPGDEGKEDMGFDAVVVLMEDRPDREGRA